MDVYSQYQTKNFIYNCFFSLFVIYIIKILFNYLKWRQLIMKIPSGSGRDVPFFGEFFRLAKVEINSHEAYKMMAEEFAQSEEGISRLTILNEHLIYLYKAEKVKPVMSNKILRKSKNYKLLTDFAGYGLFTSEGEIWQKKRKMLTPAFHLHILEQFIGVFNQEAQILVSIIEEKEGQVQDVYLKCKACALDIIVETSMGRTISAQKGEARNFVRAAEIQSLTLMKRFFNPLLRFKPFFMLTSQYKNYAESLQILNQFSDETIKERKEQRARSRTVEEIGHIPEKKKRRQAFLDLLLQSQEDDPTITDKDIRDEVNTFMFAGHDTTATSLSFTIFLLGNNQEKQKLLHEELDNIFGDSDRPVTAEDLQEMKYLDCIIKESLRFYNPASMIDKTLDEDLVIGNYTIPAESLVVIDFVKLHMDPEQFPNPEEFKPERFLPESDEKHHPFGYIPFSAGPRNCIGQKFAMMEERVILATIFRKFKAESVLGNKDMRLKLGITIMPENDKIEIKFYKRK